MQYRIYNYYARRVKSIASTNIPKSDCAPKSHKIQKLHLSKS